MRAHNNRAKSGTTMPDDNARADLPATQALKGGPTVARLGFGAMRIAGPGVWDHRATRRKRLPCCAAPSNWG
jgi:hypothetical protein